MDYQQVAKELNLAPQEVQALVEFRKGREYQVVKAFADGFLQQAEKVLLGSDNLEEILRSQGEVRGLKKIFDKIDNVVERVNG